MSVAERFKSIDLVPNCIPEFDLSTYDDDDLDHTDTYISGLTLAEALNIYWNLENISLAYTASATYFGNDSLPVYVTAGFDQTLAQSSPSSPKSRVCSNWNVSNPFVATESDGQFYDRTDEDGSSESYYMDISMLFGFYSDITSSFITKSPDDTYVVWLSFYTQKTLRSALELHGRGNGNLGGDERQLIATQDVSVGVAGTMRLKLWAISVYAPGSPNSPAQYASDGSLDSFSLTLNYYTYP